MIRNLNHRTARILIDIVINKRFNRENHRVVRRHELRDPSRDTSVLDIPEKRNAKKTALCFRVIFRNIRVRKYDRAASYGKGHETRVNAH